MFRSRLVQRVLWSILGLCALAMPVAQASASIGDSVVLTAHFDLQGYFTPNSIYHLDFSFQQDHQLLASGNVDCIVCASIESGGVFAGLITTNVAQSIEVSFDVPFTIVVGTPTELQFDFKARSRGWEWDFYSVRPGLKGTILVPSTLSGAVFTPATTSLGVNVAVFTDNQSATVSPPETAFVQSIYDAGPPERAAKALATVLSDSSFEISLFQNAGLSVNSASGQVRTMAVFAPVPEPGNCVMLVFGLGALMAVRRSKVFRCGIGIGAGNRRPD